MISVFTIVLYNFRRTELETGIEASAKSDLGRIIDVEVTEPVVVDEDAPVISLTGGTVLLEEGDPFTGDPPFEFQGWYSVYDTDRSTLKVLEKYSKRWSQVD